MTRHVIIVIPFASSGIRARKYWCRVSASLVVVSACLVPFHRVFPLCFFGPTHRIAEKHTNRPPGLECLHVCMLVCMYAYICIHICTRTHTPHTHTHIHTHRRVSHEKIHMSNGTNPNAKSHARTSSRTRSNVFEAGEGSAGRVTSSLVLRSKVTRDVVEGKEGNDVRAGLLIQSENAKYDDFGEEGEGGEGEVDQWGMGEVWYANLLSQGYLDTAELENRSVVESAREIKHARIRERAHDAFKHTHVKTSWQPSSVTHTHVLTPLICIFKTNSGFSITCAPKRMHTHTHTYTHMYTYKYAHRTHTLYGFNLKNGAF